MATDEGSGERTGIEPIRLEVGRIDRPHGLRGELIVTLTTTELDRIAPGALLYAGDRELCVASSSRHKHRYIVAFSTINGRDQADELVGAVLSADHVGDVDLDPDAFWVHELIGAEVVDGAGTAYGSVTAVQANPASDLLVLESGALVPLTFVVRWVNRPTRLEIDPPAGLFDSA